MLPHWKGEGYIEVRLLEIVTSYPIRYFGCDYASRNMAVLAGWGEEDICLKTRAIMRRDMIKVTPSLIGADQKKASREMRGRR